MSLRQRARAVHLILKQAGGIVGVKGVVLDGKLKESTGLLDEQIDLKCKPQGGAKCSAQKLFSSLHALVYTHAHVSRGLTMCFSIHLFFSTSSTGTLRIGVPLISRIRSPTCMEFFTSGLMQSESTLKTQTQKHTQYY